MSFPLHSSGKLLSEIYYRFNEVLAIIGVVFGTIEISMRILLRHVYWWVQRALVWEFCFANALRCQNFFFNRSSFCVANGRLSFDHFSVTVRFLTHKKSASVCLSSRRTRKRLGFSPRPCSSSQHCSISWRRSSGHFARHWTNFSLTKQTNRK